MPTNLAASGASSLTPNQPGRRRSSLRLWLPIAVLPAVLAGCSTQPYQGQVTAMAAGLTEVQRSFADMSEQERRAFVASQIQVALNDEKTFILPAACDPLVPPAELDCGLQTASLGAEPVSVVFTPAAPHGLSLASAMGQYGAGLSELADASDVQALKAAAGDAAAAISHLAATVDLAGGGTGGGAIAAVGPLTTVAVGLFGAYLDAARLEELRDAVNAAAPHVRDAAELLGGQAGLMQESLVRYRATSLGTKSKELDFLRRTNPGETDKINQMAHELLSESIALQRYAKSDPKQPFMAMQAAHEELAKSLNDPDIDLGTVFAKLEEFTAQIETLRSALAAINGSN